MLRLTNCEKLLLLVFILTLPFINPWVRGDGVGYYAYARSLLIEHKLDFQKDWIAANPSFRMGRVDGENHVLQGQYTSTGHLDDHFSVGPAILWSPFLLVAHAGVLLYDKVGGHVPPDGYSRPYVWAMAIGTAIFGFLALWISFRIARKRIPERWAFLATLGIWFASSLPVYMYFNPSWSHAHSAFIVALFLWYWDRTRAARSPRQWTVLGLIGGLMMDVYYVNAILLLLPLFESLPQYWKVLRKENPAPIASFVFQHVLFVAVAVLAFLPTLISKQIIYGSYFSFGYGRLWDWRSPAILKVLLSSDHGLFSWTPILIIAVAGLFLLRKHEPEVGLFLILIFAAYLYTIGCYEDWAGISSFGNRFFVSLTAVFILGLAAFFEWLGRIWQGRRPGVLAMSATAIFIVWNLGLMFQWGTHLIPARGPISWRDAAYNQVAVVPAQATRTLKSYMTRRKRLMGQIEREDVNQIKSTGPNSAE